MPQRKLLKYDKQLNIRLSEEEFNDLRDKARRAGMSMSEFIRDLIWRTK